MRRSDNFPELKFANVVTNAKNTFNHPPRGAEVVNVAARTFTEQPYDMDFLNPAAKTDLHVPAICRTLRITGGIAVAHLTNVSDLSPLYSPDGRTYDPRTDELPDTTRLWLKIDIARGESDPPLTSLRVALNQFSGKGLDTQIEQAQALRHLPPNDTLIDAVDPNDPLLAPLIKDDIWNRDITVAEQLSELRSTLHANAVCPTPDPGAYEDIYIHAKSQPESYQGDLHHRHVIHKRQLHLARHIMQELYIAPKAWPESIASITFSAWGTCDTLHYTAPEAQQLINIFYRQD